MPRLNLPFASYAMRSAPASPARLVNCFPEKLPDDAKSPYALVRAPGIVDWLTVGEGPIRGMHAALDYLWVVSGARLYRVSSALAVTELGVVGTSSRVDMDSNATTVVVVNEPIGYYYDTTTSTFGQIADVDFTSRGASDVEFLDNFLLFVEPNSGRFFGSDVGSATAYSSLSFATAEGSPDKLVGLKVDHRQALLLGEKSLEIWDLVGGAGFPFARASNGFIEIGCLNGKTAVKVDQSVIWLANDFSVRRLNGITPERISQAGIEQRIQNCTIASGKAAGYAQDGHIFYVLTFPEGTFVYDCTTKQWHERQSYGYDYWRAQVHESAFGLQLVGDSESNKIGYLDPPARGITAVSYQEWGAHQRMEWTYQPVYADGNRAFHDRLEVVLETGTGQTIGPGVDPEMMMELSDDGGLTWEGLPNQKIGKQGEYGTVVEWPQLGSSYQRVYRGSVTDPVKIVIADTQLDARGARALKRQR
jgi:hypothetical protein